VKEYQFSTKYIFIILLAFIPGLILPVYSQIQNFNIQQNSCFLKNDEKVYLQLEKNIYISGEELKYKAYIVNSYTLKRSLQSKVLYFEISGNDTRVFSWRTNLNKGLCHGTVILPDTISGGMYTLRAYTNWMRNTSPDFYYSARIIITRINESDLNQLWFPIFSTDENIRPQSLAYSQKPGINIDIESNQSDKLIINISSKSDYFLYNKLLHLITFLRGQIIDNVPVILNDSVTKVEISKSDIYAGILNIVCTDSYYHPLCEKQVYIYPENFPLIEINTSKTKYGKKEKVRFELDLSNTAANDTVWLSISVTEKTPFQSIINNPGILSYLLLYSEIAGYTYFPDSIMLTPETLSSSILETVKTYKYTSDQWLNENKAPCPYIMENKGFVFNGKVRYRDTEKPVKNELVTLSCVDSITSLKYCYTDSGGNFYFLLDKSYDNRDLILQLINQDNYNIIWQPDSKYSSASPGKYKPIPITARGEEYLEYARQIALVSNTYRQNKEINNLPEIAPVKTDRRNFYGRDVSKVYPADFIELIDFRDISENILPGVKFRKRRDICFIQIYDHNNQIIMPPEATVFLNGVPFKDLDYISSFGSNDIKQIDIYYTQLLYGDLSFYGLLSIKTYDEKIPDTYLKNYVYVFNNKVQSSFISDNNNLIRQIDNNAGNYPDFRHTLFWEPSLTVTGQNKVIIEFYTSELKAMYNIIVQGLTSSGIPLGAVSEIEVK
jgi:hypothetical protein